MIRFVPPLRTERYPQHARDVAWRWEAEWAPLRARLLESDGAAVSER